MSRITPKPNSIQMSEGRKTPRGSEERKAEERRAEENSSSNLVEMDYSLEQHNPKSTKLTDLNANRTDDPSQNFQKPENRQGAPKDSIEAPELVWIPIEVYQPTIPPRIHEHSHSEIRKPPPAVSRQSTQPNTLVKRKQGPTEDSPGLISMVTDGLRSFVYPEGSKQNAQYSYESAENSTRSGKEANSNNQQMNYQKRLPDHEEAHRSNGSRQDPRKPELKENLRRLLEAERRKVEQERVNFERDWNNMNYNHNIVIQKLRAELQECESQRQQKVEELNTFICKQQEATLKNMTSARWLPDDESSAKGDLETLKLNIKTWAKGAAARDNSLFQKLENDDHIALMREVSNVALLDDGGQLPSGLLATNKCPMLLLKALLAHSIYIAFFRSPFFFFEEGEDEVASETEQPGAVPVKTRVSKSKRQRILEEIWEAVQHSNEEEAHTWRSETLRVLMPPLRNDSPESTRELRRKTKSLIANAAKLQTERFLASPARHLGVNLNVDKLVLIFHEAARIAFKLWTRRITIECFTIRDCENLVFDAESREFDPDALVRHSNDENHFKNEKVTLLAHPLLKVYGTDDAKDYDQERVWTRGIVWIDSRAYKASNAEPEVPLKKVE